MVFSYGKPTSRLDPRLVICHGHAKEGGEERRISREKNISLSLESLKYAKYDLVSMVCKESLRCKLSSSSYAVIVIVRIRL
eukprot:scaffold5753_cov53-Skeletonema_menzelii.AAC.1